MMRLTHTIAKFRNLSLRYKLAGLFATLFAAISLSLFVYLPARFKTQAIELMTQNAIGVVDGIAYNLAPAVYFEDSSGIAAVISAAMLNKNLVDIEVQDTTGHMIGRLTSSESILHLHECENGMDCTCIDDRVLRISTSVHHEELTIGRVSVCFTLAPMRQEVANSRLMITVLSILVFGLGMLLMLVVGWLVTQRLWRIAQASDDIAKGDLDRRVTDNSRDEIGRLAEMFNLMAISVQEADISLREHAKELSHELVEKQRAQAEANRAKEFLVEVINSMPAPLVAVESDGRITLWNKTLESEVGLKSDSIDGAFVWDIVPILAEHKAIVRDAIESGQTQKRERLQYHSSSSLRYLDVLVYPLHAEARGAVIRIDDVTEEVRMLELMAQTEKMMSVGGLAAGMAHEINNPLGIIVQSVQNIQRRIAHDLAMNAEVAKQAGVSIEGIQTYFEKRNIPTLIRDILDAGKRASTIVTNMLNFSRHSSSGIMPVSIDEVIRRAVELAANDYDLKKKYDFRHIDVSIIVDPALPAVPCIESKFEQVVLNLLKNAAQAIGEHGSNGKPSITCRAFAELNQARIEVEDNGPGMTEEVRRRVFEPFFTTKEVGTGTGLGLSVSYFIICENHGGKIFVESTVGKGTKFIILLPLQHDSQSAAVA